MMSEQIVEGSSPADIVEGVDGFIDNVTDQVEDIAELKYKIEKLEGLDIDEISDEIENSKNPGSDDVTNVETGTEQDQEQEGDQEQSQEQDQENKESQQFYLTTDKIMMFALGTGILILILKKRGK